MLTGRKLLVVAAFAAAAFLAAPPAGAAAQGGANCPDEDPYCDVDYGDPGTPGTSTGGGGGGGPQRCVYEDGPASADYAPGDEVPCNDPQFGWWGGNPPNDFARGCWYSELERDLTEYPPPDGQGPEGGWYVRVCIYQPIGGCTFYCSIAVWLDESPAPPDPETLARRALARILLLPPDLRVAPPETGAGLVGLPVWLSVGTGENVWGTVVDDECDRGLCVDIRADVSRVDWDLGDGATLSCTRAELRDSAWRAGRDARQPGPCHHYYPRPSRDRPDGRYPITATATWDVAWEGGGEEGVLTATRTSTTSIRINEIQVLVTYE